MASTNLFDQTIKTDLPSMTGGLINQTNTATTAPLTPTTGTTGTGDKYNSFTQAPTMDAYGFTPVTRTPNANETVAGQFNSLTQNENPLMTMSRTMAKQQMNQKGLLNSSMALGAADAAAYQAALPIAQADAGTYKAVGDMNQNAQNQALQTNTAALNDASKVNMDSFAKVAGANMDAANKSTLANIEANYKTLVQANTSASSMYEKSMQNITDISMSADLEPEAKTNAIQTQLKMLETSLAMLGKMNNLGLGDLLTFNYDADSGGVTNTGTAGQ